VSKNGIKGLSQFWMNVNWGFSDVDEFIEASFVVEAVGFRVEYLGSASATKFCVFCMFCRSSQYDGWHLPDLDQLLWWLFCSCGNG
jgi:hypothetical protein